MFSSHTGIYTHHTKSIRVTLSPPPLPRSAGPRGRRERATQSRAAVTTRGGTRPELSAAAGSPEGAHAAAATASGRGGGHPAHRQVRRARPGGGHPDLTARAVVIT